MIMGRKRAIGASVRRRPATRLHGLTILEALVALAVFLAGVIPIIVFLPGLYSARKDAATLTKAALLGQMKAEEIRRDDDVAGTLVNTIAARTEPTLPLPFATSTDLSYAFSGVSLKYAATDSPRGDPNVARVLVVRTNRPSTAVSPKDVIYELRFAY